MPLSFKAPGALDGRLLTFIRPTIEPVNRFTSRGPTATPVVALALALAAGGCESPAAAVAPQARVFTVAEADQQRLPAHHDCPAPADGMSSGTLFLEGELTLYPESAFSWRYTIQQYVTREGSQQEWLEPFHVTGTYAQRGDALELISGEGVIRTGRITGDVVELAESVPCRLRVEGAVLHQTTLYLTEEAG